MAISHAAGKTTDSCSCTGHFFYLLVKYPILPVLWLWWCVSVPSRQHALTLAHPTRGALQCCCCSLYKPALFKLGKCMQLPTFATSETGDESVRLFCFDSMNSFCFIISCGRKEEGFPVVKKIRQRLLLHELLKLFWLLFVKNKNFESFPRILGYP